MDDTGLQVQQHSPGDVVLIIRLQREQEDLNAAAAWCHLAAGEPHMAGPGEREEGERLLLSSVQHLCAQSTASREGEELPVLT